MIKDLVAVEVKSLGRAHLIANQVACESVRDKSLELLELYGLGGKASLLIKGAQEDLLRLVKDIPSRDLVRSQIIENVNEEVLKALLSLDSASLHSSAVVLEASFIGDLLFVAQKAVSLGFKIVDLRAPRVAQAPGYLILTESPSLSQANELWSKLEALCPPEARWTLLEKLHPKYVDFFSIS